MALTIASVKMFLRDRTALFFTFFFPLAIMGLFGVIHFDNFSKANLAVVDQSGSPISAGFIEGLRKIPVLKLSTGSLSAELQALAKGDLDLVVLIPSGFTPQPGTPAVLPAYYNDGRPQQAQVAQAVLGQAFDQYTFSLLHTQPLAKLDLRPVVNHQLTYIDFLLPGILALSLMQLGLFSVAFGFVQLKKQGILRRMLATPILPSQFLAAQIINRVLIAMGQMAILLGLGVFVLKLHVVGSIVQMFLLGLLGAGLFLAMGFAVSGFAKTEDQAAPLVNLISFPMMMLAGTFFPRDAFPSVLKVITNYLPLTYLADAMRETSNNGASLWDLRGDVIGLVVWFVICVMAAIRLFRWE
jgi:ABC-2 type transport system permease protein